MPSVAYHSDADALEFAARAKPEQQYVCPECNRKVAYVPTHKRGESDVRSFFRYDNCGHRGVLVDENTGGGSGGGGAGGESERHKRRKYDALQVALTLFPEADYALEEDIGDKRPDAKLVFDTPHPQYGKGLAIEYQHKNEGKDIEATQEYFAKREFTTVWLWDGQFDYSSSPPDIDFYGGEVYTPWPDAVPDHYGSDIVTHRHYFAQTKFEYEPKGDPSPVLPPEYGMQFVDMNMLIKNSKGTHEHKLSEIRDGAEQLPPVTFVKDAERFIYKKHFQGQIRERVAEFHNRVERGFAYKSEEYIKEVRDSLSGGNVRITTGPWVEVLLARKASVAYGDDAEIYRCENCNEKQLGDPISDAENVRSIRCRHCGEWNVQKNIHKGVKA